MTDADAPIAIVAPAETVLAIVSMMASLNPIVSRFVSALLLIESIFLSRLTALAIWIWISLFSEM